VFFVLGRLKRKIRYRH